MSQRSSWRIFWSSGMSKTGLGLLIVFVLISFYVALVYPLDFGTRFWNNPSYWADNPKEVPPEWTNLFTQNKLPTHITAVLVKPREYSEQRFVFDFDDFPSFVSVTVSDVTYAERPQSVIFELKRPDGSVATFYTLTVASPLPMETSPFKRHFDTPLRIYISGDLQAASYVSAFWRDKYGVDLSPDEVVRVGVEKFLFGHNVAGELKVLRGVYVLAVSVVSGNVEDEIGQIKVTFGGKVFGVMGTDRLGRDLATGLLFGFPVSLLIGLVTALLTTVIGSSLGMVSGYYGGKVDEVIQRVCDVLNNIPLLPLLIFFTFILKPSIWIIILILVVFGWSGLTIVVRSIVLQARTVQFVEAAESFGLSRRRVLLKHIMPQIAPFLISQLIFLTPSAILAEAALSFLGLGDPSLPSWGQILEYGFRSGGVNLGIWWWIFPPGALIAMISLTFVFLSMGLEPVVSPRLRRMV